MTPPLSASRIVALSVAALAALAMAFVATTPDVASAQTPAVTSSPAATATPSARVEQQAAAIERQLLCPICTNERLDVCAIAICGDMKRIIRERLTAGSTPDDIMLYFEQRYGEKVRAELPAQGFNLWLYGWIGASMLAVAAAGAWFLLSLRRRARPSPVRSEGARGPGSPTDADEAWLDAQIAADDDPSGPTSTEGMR